jgi:hypothetical protein
MEYYSALLYPLLTEFFKFILVELSAIICPQHLNYFLCLILNKSLKLFKFVKDFRFLLEEIYPIIP